MDDPTDVKLATRQNHLQDQSRVVLADLDLMRILGAVGQPHLVGSAAMGLMAWPDIDLNIPCLTLDAGRIWAALHPLAAHPGVKKLRWTSERGPFNSTGQPQDDGFYLGVHFHEGATAHGQRWKIDCWFLPAGVPRPEFTLMERMARELTDETRLAILRIKDTWYRRPEYRDTVVSIDIYRAVLDDGVLTPDGFAEWLLDQDRRPDLPTP